MKLNFSYDLSAPRVLRDPTVYSRLPLLYEAGVRHVNLNGYFYGHYIDTPEDLRSAKARLEEAGFSVGIINLACGHGGNALDPDDPSIPLEIGEGWSYTYGWEGNLRYNTTCIDERMISDTRKAVDLYRQLGFSTIFYDDDLRLGHWGRDLQGCYCPRCMEEFSKRFGREVSREEIHSQKDPILSEAWMSYQCEKIPHFLLGVTSPGITSAIMVMHEGGRNHGVDIKLLRKLMPDNLLFRVGEAHFNDADFKAPGARNSIINSITKHLALIGNNDIAYSETTVYPSKALSPENWVEKMRNEIDCGLRNLYLMSGTIFLQDEYWYALRAALPELYERADQ